MDAATSPGQHLDADPHQLSGRQHPRLDIARTLATEPNRLLCHESTSALSPENIDELPDVTAALAEEGTTMLMVTHKVWFGRAAANRVVFINGRHGS